MTGPGLPEVGGVDRGGGVVATVSAGVAGAWAVRDGVGAAEVGCVLGAGAETVGAGAEGAAALGTGAGSAGATGRFATGAEELMAGVSEG